MKTEVSTRKSFNGSQKERPLKLGMHDISCADYFTVGNQSFRYTLNRQQFSNDYSVYILDPINGKECIGYATPDRNKISISVRRHGFDWSTRVSLSDIKIYGTKHPED